VTRITQNEREIADVFGRGPSGLPETAWIDNAEATANACLIAAATDLLAACDVALDWLGDCEKGTAQAEIADELRAAIAKARGTA
jgi:hypothetical protein